MDEVTGTVLTAALTRAESGLAYAPIIKALCAHLRTQTHRPCSGDPRMILEGVKNSFTATLTFEPAAEGARQAAQSGRNAYEAKDTERRLRVRQGCDLLPGEGRVQSGWVSGSSPALCLKYTSKRWP